MYITSSLLFLSFSLLPHLQAYKIDSSCKDHDYDLMKTAAEQAFEMADGAYVALTETGIENGHYANVDRLLELLFNTNRQNPNDPRLVELRGSFLGIKMMRRDNPKPENTVDEVVIYCNVDRLEKRKDGWYDSVSGTALSDPPNHNIDECRRMIDATLAYTFVPENESGPTGPSQVTVCPWFLQYSRQFKYRTLKDMTPKFLLARLAVPLSKTTLGPFEPIDTLNMLDKVLLGEFTHTVAGGRTVDVNWSNNKLFKVAYGWTSCTELAKSGQVGAEYNADSLALFASGVRLLNQDSPMYITDDGKVTKKDPRSENPAPNGMNVPRYFESAQSTAPPIAFERFITMIKERRATATAISS